MGLPFPIQEHHEAKTKNNEAKAPSSPSSSPLLLFLLGELSGETTNAICDPVAKVFKVVEFPELSCQLECLASGHGWLLLISREASSLFFFNPLTRQRIDLVYRSCVVEAAAFSAPPTSPSCTIFAITRNFISKKVNLDVLQVGKDESWTRFEYIIPSSVFGHVMRMLYSNGVLYCVDLQGRVISFDEKNNGDWKVLCKQKFKQVDYSCVVELNGEIFAVKKKSCGEIGKLFKVRVCEGEGDEAAVWEEVKDIGDVTLFLGPHGACAVTGLDEELRKKVFVTGYDPETKFFKLLNYECQGGELKETMKFYATKFSCLHASIWI